MNSYPAPIRRGLADQLVEHLVAAILRGDHAPDSQLPPEDKLAEAFKVSRLTVREAVKALRHKGVLRVEQGRGTFVNQPSRWSPLDPDLLMARASSTEGTRDLAVKLTEARAAMAVHMHQTADRINEVIEQDGLRLSLPPPHRSA